MAKKRIRVNSKGKKTKKLICPDGKKAQGNRCITMKSGEKRNRKKAIRKMVRTKRKNPGVTRIANKARKRAMRKRKSKGL